MNEELPFPADGLSGCDEDLEEPEDFEEDDTLMADVRFETDTAYVVTVISGGSDPQAVSEIAGRFRKKEGDEAAEAPGHEDGDAPGFPADLKFKTEQEASQVCGRIRAAGGIAFVKTEIGSVRKIVDGETE